MGTPSMRSLDQLLTAVEKNEFLDKSMEAYADYGFVNCTEEDDEEDLFNVYTTLIQIVKCDTAALHVACGQGTLAQFIEEELKKGKQLNSYFGEFFMKNKHLVKNAYTK